MTSQINRPKLVPLELPRWADTGYKGKSSVINANSPSRTALKFRSDGARGLARASFQSKYKFNLALMIFTIVI